MIDLLKEVYLFKRMDEEQIKQVCGISRFASYQPGQKIIQEGQVGNLFYVIQHGEVEVYTQSFPEAEKQVLAKLGSGRFFGEVAALLGYTRTASVTAISQTNALEIDGKELQKLMLKDSAFCNAMFYGNLEEFAKRQVDSNRQIQTLEEKKTTLEARLHVAQAQIPRKR